MERIWDVSSHGNLSGDFSSNLTCMIGEPPVIGGAASSGLVQDFFEASGLVCSLSQYFQPPNTELLCISGLELEDSI